MSLENLTLGTEIRGARERAGYTVAKIAEISRIRETLIKDIEADDFTSCGGNAYARGHIRTIAKIVKLNPDQLIEKFAQSTGDFDRPMVDLLEENNVIKPRSARPQIGKTLLKRFNCQRSNPSYVKFLSVKNKYNYWFYGCKNVRSLRLCYAELLVFGHKKWWSLWF